MGTPQLTELTLYLHRETEKAIHVSDDGDEERAVWLPKSQIEYDRKEAGKPVIEATVPIWLAKDKGLI